MNNEILAVLLLGESSARSALPNAPQVIETPKRLSHRNHTIRGKIATILHNLAWRVEKEDVPPMG